MNFYKQAAQILQRLDNHEGSIKTLCLSDKVKDKKRMYAVICETLKYRDVIKLILERSNLTTQEKKVLSGHLSTILIHDMIFTKRGIQAGDGPIKQAILRHKTRLSAELVKLKVQENAKTNEELIADKIKAGNVSMPRYVRVNLLKNSVSDVLKRFKSNGWNISDSPIVDFGNLSPQTVYKDKHLPDLLVLPPNTDLHAHTLTKSGGIILQDKASCFPASILHPPKNAIVIDACAAPGNKTSHLSSLMQNTGTILAFDLDQRRLETLKRLTNRAGCKNITPIHGSFLDTNPSDSKFKNVTHLLLDPSCSGSGIVSRLDYLVDGSAESEDSAGDDSRLKSLAEFQVNVILHAMKFPKAQRIVYSTCSIHSIENEKVVQTILNSQSDFVLVKRDDVLPTWDRRGQKGEGLSDEDCEKVIRASPDDFTNGFFVALFERVTRKDGLTTANSRKVQKRKAETIADSEIPNARQRMEVDEKVSGGGDTEGEVDLVEDSLNTANSSNKKKKKKKKKSKPKSLVG
ncbi:S-adenosyl-L-methionine-dependent methyltransferase [Paraphysoderma sedebokerense]|nr:S-adenosyl-L-methionine-dependent methyltransferase [Paraphysoderma sedebokerense]